MRKEKYTKKLPIPTQAEILKFYQTYDYEERDLITLLSFRLMLVDNFSWATDSMNDLHTQVIKDAFIPTRVGKHYYRVKTIKFLEENLTLYLDCRPYVLNEINQKIQEFTEALKEQSVEDLSEEEYLLKLSEYFRAPYSTCTSDRIRCFSKILWNP